MVLFKIQLSIKFAVYTNTYLYNIPLYVDLFCFNVPHQQMLYYFMGPRGHKIIKGHEMDKFRIKNHNILPTFEISSELFSIFVCNV